ncbi:hypothetical protein Ahy_A04g017567 [Arachis hypogaea]|uniref:Aquaporin n=1 Tax=Arachis hypogaea TaxID=3818 RepID=A0A445DBE1_ARAHY|nr:hypothetical protein Ahy_A04g017567 [Arachis hypogaea]
MEEEGEEKVGKGVHRRCSSTPLLFVVRSLNLAAAPRCSSSFVAAPRQSPLLPIGFAVFLVHLATIPITGTRINPARSLGAAIIFNKKHAWNDQKKEKGKGKGKVLL